MRKGIQTGISALLIVASLPVAFSSPKGSIVSELQPFVDNHELAGAVTLVASKDDVLSLDALGYADVAAKKPMKTDCLFWIASMSKPIAATALMMLVDEGKVRLDNPVQDYLPRFTPKIIKSDGTRVLLESPQRPITVRSLLSHTSGVETRSSLETPTLDSYPLAVRVESYSLEPLLSEPGTEWSYSNAGINTAARIIEVVSGMTYSQFLQTRLFDPLGMKDTTFWPTNIQLKRLAKAYKPTDSGSDLQETLITQLRYPLSDREHRYEMPAGGLFSTAKDLAKFCQMLLAGGIYEGHQYITAASIREMTTNQVSGSARNDVLKDWQGVDGYGLGWFTSTSGEFGHGGAYATSMRINPKTGLITIWLVQHVGFPGDGSKSVDTFQRTVSKRFGSTETAALGFR